MIFVNPRIIKRLVSKLTLVLSTHNYILSNWAQEKSSIAYFLILPVICIFHSQHAS